MRIEVGRADSLKCLAEDRADRRRVTPVLTLAHYFEAALSTYRNIRRRKQGIVIAPQLFLRK